ncbi:MAG: NifB/NifX family molybdenum-iron cluster-binding protein [Candidatus Krumholzibacteriota bacterium]|nr:NifB/NifX family molybdenum-iron cluster-binding protein [Candidatus Krumholzibacteriota bacterium]
MRIAVTAQGPDKDSPVDERFGRAKHFVIYDTETGEYTAVDNAVNMNAMQGAGIQSGERMAKENINVVLTGHVGPKAFRTLQAAGVTIASGISGTVADAIAAWKDGKLQVTGGPDVQGHWQ